MNSSIISTSIGDIAVYDNQVRSEKTLVFLHGVFLDHSLWDYQINNLPEYRCIAVDMPGHGLSQNVQSNWSLDDCGQMLLDIIKEMGLKDLIVVGH